MSQDTPKNIAETIIDEMRSRCEIEYVSVPCIDEPQKPLLVLAPKDMVLHDLTRQHREVIEALKPLQRTQGDTRGSRQPHRLDQPLQERQHRALRPAAADAEADGDRGLSWRGRLADLGRGG